MEESSSVETKHIPSLGSTHEPSPKPQTLKERVVHPSEYSIEIKDYGNTSKLSRHEKNIKEVSLRVEPSKEWLMEAKYSSEAIQILSPSMTIPCSLRETNIDALHNPTIGTSIMLEFLAKNLLG